MEREELQSDSAKANDTAVVEWVHEFEVLSKGHQSDELVVLPYRTLILASRMG